MTHQSTHSSNLSTASNVSRKIKKVLIIGGVAGGASCAARLRRLDEFCEITMIERGPYVSFANCGLPYHISGKIAERKSLIVTTQEKFNSRFNIKVLSRTEALKINRAAHSVQLIDLANQKTWEESYDFLVLSPGAEPIRPPIAGIDLPGVYVLRNIPDLDRIMKDLATNQVKKVAVIGAGFIGIETAENLRERNLDVTLIEKADQVMPLLDREISSLLATELREHGISVQTSKAVTAISTASSPALSLQLDDGTSLAADLVILAIGVRPETVLAKEAGLEIGPQGGIFVDKQMRTSDENIFAVGDAVEVTYRVTGLKQRVPLAGPANRQGRLVADAIAGRSLSYPGTLGTSIVKVFNLAAASVGLSQRQAETAKLNFEVAWVHGKSHAGYYPDAQSMLLKLIFDRETGKIFGAQIVGQEGVDKRMDVLATAIYAELTVFDLEWLDLSYAPPFSSAKDPVNQLASVAAGMMRNDHPTARWSDVTRLLNEGYMALDVRTPAENHKSRNFIWSHTNSS
jgi:NADPH-dependent 2,4-dienoyl-CoA reductase/sulfur reductase-like enzyme